MDFDGQGGPRQPEPICDGNDINFDFHADEDFNPNYPGIRVDPSPIGAVGPFLADGTIALFLGVQSEIFPPVPFGIQLPETNRRFMGTFSIKRDRIEGLGGFPACMELRLPAEGINDPPFFQLDLDLPQMRNGLVLADGTSIDFDDFVFKIIIP